MLSSNIEQNSDKMSYDDLIWVTSNMPEYFKYNKMVRKKSHLFMENVSYVSLQNVVLSRSNNKKHKAGSVHSVPTSRATSDITMFSTKHSRKRNDERDITRREVQHTIKHGQVTTSWTGNRVISKDGVSVIMDPRTPVVVTSWKDRLMSIDESSTR